MAKDSIWGRLLNHDIKNFEVRISPDRLIALTDGVFAIAITLLILSIALPEYTFTNSDSMENFLKSSINYLIPVIISFVILGEYWIQHHHFMKVKRINIPFLWFNIFYLLFIMFIPFTTSLMCQYEEFAIAEIPFGIVITLTTLMSLIMYWYAAKNDLLEIDNKVENRYTIKSMAYLIFITIAINLLINFITPYALVLFLLIPIFSIALSLKRDKFLKECQIEIYEKSELLEHIKKDAIVEYMLKSKIEDYINENYREYEQLNEKEQKKVKIEALDHLKVRICMIIDEGKKEL